VLIPTKINVPWKLNYRGANAANVAEESILDELLKLDAITGEEAKHSPRSSVHMENISCRGTYSNSLVVCSSPNLRHHRYNRW